MPIWEAVSRSIRTKRVSNHTWSKANSTTDFQLGTQTHTLTLKRYVQSSTHRLLFDIACSLMGITNRLAAWLDILCTTELVIKYLVIWAIPVDLPFCWTKLPEFSKDVSRSTKSVIFSLRNILVKGFETVARNSFKLEFSCIYTIKSRICNAFIYFPYYQSKPNR